MRKKALIPVYKPYLNGNEKEYVNQCLDSTWISSKGEFISRFESGFADYIGAHHATSVCNGTVAIHLALEALGIGQGDEVIVPTLTYIASVNTILQTGAKPIFVDSLSNTWQIDASDVKRKITSKTKAIMAVHLYGLPCDMDCLTTLCQEHGLLLIEDCAEAFGSKYKGRHVGTFGDVATFSFFGNKTISTGEGGMVITKSKAAIEKAYHLKNQGVSSRKEYWHDVIAYNYRMTNICAAIGLAQLEMADEIIFKKRRIAEIYRNELKNSPVVFHNEVEDTFHSYWMCSIMLNDSGKRDELRKHLSKSNIETRKVFYPANTMPHCYTDEKFAVAEKISSAGINLPSYPSLTVEQIKYICAEIKQFLNNE